MPRWNSFLSRTVEPLAAPARTRISDLGARLLGSPTILHSGSPARGKSIQREPLEALENARNTVEEPGNLRFDVNQQADDPDRFVLYEVYRDESGMKAHKETAHYARWRDTVAGWMAEPRRGVPYEGLFPESEEEWATRG